MKKQSTLLKGAIIVFTFCITTLIISCGPCSTDAPGDNRSSQRMIHPSGSSIFPGTGNIEDLKQTITTESDLNQRNLLAGSSPLVSACLFARKILHYQ